MSTTENRITIDRAKSIADACVRAGLAEAPNRDKGTPYIFSPAIKAKFADVGVSKVGQLNFDQAADVEAFIYA